MTGMLRRLVLTTLTACLGVVALAPPAGAHGIEGVAATNYRTRIERVSPRIAGLTVAVVEAGSRLELVNRTGKDVTIFGYQSEPYLLVKADGGVFENRRSPSTYVNADRQATLQPPPDADPSAKPEWREIDRGNVVRWHDHRAHWMGTRDAPAVRRAPSRTHVVIPEWEIEVRVGSGRSVVTGDLTWIPGPSPAPWLLAALALGVATIAVSLPRWGGRALAVVVGLLVVLDIIHVAGKAAGGAGGFAAGVGAVLSGSFFSLAAWAAGGLAVRFLLKSSDDGPFAAGFAGAIIALFGGVADFADLSSSQVPFGYGDFAARLLVAVSLGVGLGLVAAAILRLRLHGSRPVTGLGSASGEPQETPQQPPRERNDESPVGVPRAADGLSSAGASSD